MRVVKEANERKNEILDAAERLFGSKGFDHTSTNDILKEVGIARGTLYYHFSSKEEILDAMIERMTGRLIEKARAIGAQKDIPVLQRLTMMILSLKGACLTVSFRFSRSWSKRALRREFVRQSTPKRRWK